MILHIVLMMEPAENVLPVSQMPIAHPMEIIMFVIQPIIPVRKFANVMLMNIGQQVGHVFRVRILMP